MATTFKTFLNNDIAATRTMLHEAIPITGTITSGSAYTDNNIKNHSHGMFQTVYDYPYLSSSANHIFDITLGISPNSSSFSSVTSQQSKKRNIYNQMAQVLVGYDVTGSVLDFDVDGNILAGGDKHRNCFIIPFSRLLVKDEIKKGSFTLKLGTGDTFAAPFASSIKIQDASGSGGYLVNSPAGEYGLLFAFDNVGTPMSPSDQPCGLLYYQAGICVLATTVFEDLLTTACRMNSSNDLMGTLAKDSNIQAAADAFRHRFDDVTFNNTTELNSTIYFCRAHHNEFNYSTNPTYLNNSKIRVKTNASDNPVSYITTIGLYNDNNELMAVAKLSEPLKKTPDVEFTLRVRLDY